MGGGLVEVTEGSDGGGCVCPTAKPAHKTPTKSTKFALNTLPIPLFPLRLNLESIVPIILSHSSTVDRLKSYRVS